MDFNQFNDIEQRLYDKIYANVQDRIESTTDWYLEQINQNENKEDNQNETSE